MAPAGGATGAYGFRITGIDAPSPPFVPCAPDSPEITMVLQTSAPDEITRHIGETRVVLPLIGGGAARMVREPPGAVLATPQPLPVAAIAHPFLAPIAAAHAHWIGRLAIHAGAIVAGGGAWGVAGPRHAGKSSFLAACAQRGIPVVADDLLVTDGESVFSGPRSIDLRPDAAERLGCGVDIGVVGMRERFRVDLPPAPRHVPLAGWVFLAWGPEVWVGTLNPTDRARRLRSKNAVPGMAPQPQVFLTAAAKPAFSLHRPRSWDDMDESIEVLMDRLGGLR